MNSPDLPQLRLHRLADLPLTNSYATLPPAFYTRLRTTPLSDPYLVCASEDAAALIGARIADLAQQ